MFPSWNEIVQEVAGKEIEPEKIASIYESVNYLVTRNEEEEISEIPSVGLKDMEKILHASGLKILSVSRRLS